MRINEILDEAIPFRGNPQTDNKVKREVDDVSHTYDDTKASPKPMAEAKKRINPKDVS